jgi:cardiolipin synthase
VKEGVGRRRGGALQHWAASILVLFVVAIAWPAAAASIPQRVRTAEELKELGRLGMPRTFVKGEHVRVYFTNESELSAFEAHWSKRRLDGRGYGYYTADLRFDKTPPKIPEKAKQWREATVLGHEEWLKLSRAVAESLTPAQPWRACYFQFGKSEGILYRDETNKLFSVPLREQPSNVSIERRLNSHEFAAAVTRLLEADARAARANQDLFMLVEASEGPATRFVLFDLARNTCVTLSSPHTSDDPRGAPHVAASLGICSSLLFESHGLALIKNPVSSIGRLLNTTFQTISGMLKAPLPSYRTPPPPVSSGPGMDLEAWEKYLDRVTGRSREAGSVKFLVDGEKFFPAFERSLMDARKKIDIHVCIFDNDDVAADYADLLKRRSSEVKVKVLLDRMSSQASALAQPATPQREDFVPPKSIISYLRRDSKVAVRAYLNTWLTADHCKVFIIDDQLAYIGGMNFGREYRYEWHDMMVEIEGEVVGHLKRDFQLAWAQAGPFGDLAFAEKALFGKRPGSQSDEPGEAQLRRIYTKTGEVEFRKAVREALGRARSTIFIENPYIYDPSIVAGLVRARRRGVDVRVIIPNNTVIGGGERRNFVTADYFRKNGVRVFIYPGMTHIKALIVDGWACFGSGNYNKLSLRTNQEVNLGTSHKPTVDELRRELFEVDFAKSYELQEPLEVNWTDQLAETILDVF